MKFKIGNKVRFSIEGDDFDGIISRVDTDNNRKEYLCYSKDADKQNVGHGNAKESNGHGSWYLYEDNIELLNNSPIGQIKVVGR